ncbi:MAG: ABC transporter permease subunit [Gammaproteobacteria bacterium]|nr:ABC transporter permease subunit [Gammaproteobacteria bacterium]
MEASNTSDRINEGQRRWKLRKAIDLVARRVVEIGGISVIAAIALIFLFLLSVVYPLFGQPSIQESGQYSTPGASDETIYLAIEEQAEIGLRVSQSGNILFFNVENGQPVLEKHLPIEADNSITSFRVVNEPNGVLAVGLQSGEVLFFQHNYELEFTETKRIIHPNILYPYGEEAFPVADGPILDFGVGDNEESTSILARTTSGQVIFQTFIKESSFIDEATRLELSEKDEILTVDPILGLLVDPEQEWAYILTKDGNLSAYDIRENNFNLREKVQVTEGDVRPTILKFLTGGISLLVGDSRGVLSQWFQVRSDGELEFRLGKIRESKIGNSPVVSLATEQLRKGVIAATQAGKIKLLYTTSERDLLSLSASDSAIRTLAVAPRADIFLAEDRNKNIKVWNIDNHHPESSFSALWGKVWYEDYVKPDYIWQSSSASSDFEPKYSLVPLTFGTLKAAFYAMLFAMPLAICGAIFTAYFMAPRMRAIVKPSIEIMEALPTVILGFLAGLWLAPFVELHLPGVFSIFVLMPIGIIILSLVWWKLPGSTKRYIPEGWQAAALIIPLILIALLCVAISPYLERVMFDGNIRIWLSEELGIGFDQRNALIIGIAMGFAVIPTIFSIAEDAIFSVPKHLTSGSLALGATPWQTLVRVVLLSASPGIFSAVMIGFGRAVGETMIVLMATGNTPVMDFSIFQGMRTLSANIAVELPESEVDSTHYRILFLAAFVLFIFTFFFNTVAEIVRQRLRKKYSSL